MEESIVRSARVRNQHYYFAQELLYEVIKSDVDYTYYLLFQNEFKEILEDVWKLTYNNFKHVEPDEPMLESNGFPYSIKEKNGNKMIVVITLPEPQATGEAYHIGLYFYKNNTKVGFRYFLNEYHDKRHSSFCERKATLHTCYGTAKTLCEKVFIKRIELAVKQSLN